MRGDVKMPKKTRYHHRKNDPFSELGLHHNMMPPPGQGPFDNEQPKHAFIVKCHQQPNDENNDFFFSDSVRHVVNYKSPNGIIVYTAQSKNPFDAPKEVGFNPKAEFEGNVVFEVVTDYNTVTDYNHLADPFAGLDLAHSPPFRCPERSRSRSRSSSTRSEEIIRLPSEASLLAEPPTLQITSLKGKTAIRIYSSAIILALKDVVEFYASQEILNDSAAILLEEPYSMLIHHWDELRAYRNARGPNFSFEDYCIREQSAFHDLGLLLDYVGDSELMSKIEAEKARHARGKATWEMLWLLYRPGMDVVSKYSSSSRTRSTARGFIVKSVAGGPYEADRSPYSISLQSLDFDGDLLNWQETFRSVSHFDGEIDISDLEVVPAGYASPENPEMSLYQHLVDKGKRFYDMTTPCCKQHEGKRMRTPHADLEGLVMVDLKTYYLHNREDRMPKPLSPTLNTTVITNCSCQVCSSRRGSECTQKKFAGYNGIDPQKQKTLTDHQYFLCQTVTRGYHFKTQQWHLLDVDDLSAPQFKTDMIDTLVMAPGQIKMLKALSKNFMRQDDEGNQLRMWSADFVEGKGSSQIFLLHGKPGVGKTYTAECIAEHTRRPLMTLTCTDIGTDAEDVERNLEKHFETAKKWGAILLIDEADVYMEKRATTDLTRNSLVASFLRALEAYEGILFLTTNRVGAFDDAFVSRIHVKLYYPPLRDADRKKIWTSFMNKLMRERKDMRVTRDAKDVIEGKKIRALQFNGREIRNAFQTAVALAEYEDEKDEEGRIIVDERHILQVAEMSKDFKCYLDDLHQGDEGKRAVREGERLDNFIADII